jgi:hypothetical protein
LPRTVDVQHQALTIAQRDQQPLPGQRGFDDVSQLHVHCHLPDVKEAARREVQAAPVPEGSVVPGCLQDRTGTQAMYQLAIGEVLPDNAIGCEGRERSRVEAISDLQRGCFIGLDA